MGWSSLIPDWTTHDVMAKMVESKWWTKWTFRGNFLGKNALVLKKYGIHSTHIMKNCRIFRFTCPLRSEKQKIDMYYNAELYYVSCEFIYQFIYLWFWPSPRNTKVPFPLCFSLCATDSQIKLKMTGRIGIISKKFQENMTCLLWTTMQMKRKRTLWMHL